MQLKYLLCAIKLILKNIIVDIIFLSKQSFNELEGQKTLSRQDKISIF